jgi:hypothetical protein
MITNHLKVAIGISFSRKSLGKQLSKSLATRNRGKSNRATGLAPKLDGASSPVTVLRLIMCVFIFIAL